MCFWGAIAIMLMVTGIFKNMDSVKTNANPLPHSKDSTRSWGIRFQPFWDSGGARSRSLVFSNWHMKKFSLVCNEKRNIYFKKKLKIVIDFWFSPFPLITCLFLQFGSNWSFLSLISIYICFIWITGKQDWLNHNTWSSLGHEQSFISCFSLYAMYFM